MRSVLGSAIGLLLLFGRPPTPAVSAASQDRPVFRSGIDVVRVDVSVLDKDRRPIRDLTAGDFTILIDGVPQPIVAFVPVVRPAEDTPTASWVRDVAPDVRTNGPAEPRLFVIVMDDFSLISSDPATVHTGKAVARAIIDQMNDGDLASVLLTLNRRHSQELTTDRERLLRAIDQFNLGFPEGSFLAGVSLGRTIRDAYGYLRDRPHLRSAIFLVGNNGKVEDPEKKELWRAEMARRNGEATGLPDDDPARLGDARLGWVPIYWFSTAGLAAPDGGTPSSFIRAAEYFHDVASLTGGRAIGDTNSPVEAVPDVVQETSAYYMIGYRPTYPVSDGRVRDLHITVDRPGVTVLPDRRSVRNPRPPKKPKRAPAPLERAMADIVPRPDIPLHVTAAPFTIPSESRRGGPPAAVTISVGVRRPAPEAQLVEHAQVLGRLYTIGGGKVAASVQDDARITLAPGGADTEFEWLGRLDAKPGRYQLRVSVRSLTLDETASVYADVTIPDFAKAPLSLSGVVISSPASPKAAPRDALAAILPAVPTTTRDFARTDEAVAFFRIYQGGKRATVPVEVRVAITNGQGREVVARPDMLPPDRFGTGRAADYTYILPLDTLEAGPYLLTITASHETTTAGPTHVRFQVR